MQLLRGQRRHPATAPARGSINTHFLSLLIQGSPEIRQPRFVYLWEREAMGRPGGTLFKIPPSSHTLSSLCSAPFCPEQTWEADWFEVSSTFPFSPICLRVVGLESERPVLESRLPY